MTLERWNLLESFFHNALQLDREKRDAFLHEMCGENPGLRREVERLISSSERSGLLDEMLPEFALSLIEVASLDPLIGQHLGRYQILSPIGAGGMGEIYLAQDSTLDRKAALKLLPRRLLLDRDSIRRFQHEARLISKINHPAIITIFDIGQDGDRFYIATEFIEGQNLREWMAETKFRLIDILEIAVQIVSALSAAHSAGIVHRDLKPENIMIRPDGYIKVLDFGLAKLISGSNTGREKDVDSTRTAFEESTQFHTHPNLTLGTPRYMSPEQIRGYEVDGRSDFFSLGVMLYELISKRAPFEGETTADILAAVLNTDPMPELQASTPFEIPAKLESVIRRALEKLPENRYQAADELLAELKAIRATVDATGPVIAASATRMPLSPPLSLEPSITDHPKSENICPQRLEPVGGAVPLESHFYLLRQTDSEFQQAISRLDSIVLVKGPRQVGKTSLLARGLQQARHAGARIILSDFQKLSAENFASVDALLSMLAESIADQLNLDVPPSKIWNNKLSPGINLERYLRRIVFENIPENIVWGIDEIDRLFLYDFGSEIFGLFRSWYNERALDPQGPWSRFTMAIAYATEAHLFITDLNQSPFNVGTRLKLEDFFIEHVAELNRYYERPLRNEEELARYFGLVGGHPYLVRRGLHEMVTAGIGIEDLETKALQPDGPFGDHLRRMLISLKQDAALCQTMHAFLREQTKPSSDHFFRLRSSGVLAGNTPFDSRPRCKLYAAFLEQHLQA